MNTTKSFLTIAFNNDKEYVQNYIVRVQRQCPLRLLGFSVAKDISV